MKEVKHVIEKRGQNSFEFGPAKQRHKIYYETPEELRQKISMIKEVMEQEKEVLSYISGETQ